MNTDEKSLHDQFCRYGRNAKEWLRKCALMLPRINEKRIWEKKGFSSIHEYAGKIAGMSHYQVNDALRIVGKLSDKPALMNVARKKGLGAVRPVACIATAETEEMWAEKASTLNKNELEAYVRDYKSGPRTTFSAESEGDKPISLSITIDPELHERLTKLKGNATWPEFLEELAALKEAQKPPISKTRSRHIPTAIKKHIRQRSKGICEHPNCKQRAHHFHHIDPFALKREHNTDRILHLCHAHHNLIHRGLLDEETWQQIDQLPSYDIRNLINTNIAHHRAPP